MSLAYLNSEKEDLTEEYRQMVASSWGPVRVCITAQEAHGDDVLLPLYTELGNRFHLEGKPRERATIEEALEAAGVLWDGVLGVAGTDGFFELKRSRTRDPDFT